LFISATSEFVVLEVFFTEKFMDGCDGYFFASLVFAVLKVLRAKNVFY
jgi:hypothetical protein